LHGPEPSPSRLWLVQWQYRLRTRDSSLLLQSLLQFYRAATPDRNGITHGILPQSVDQQLCHTPLCRRSITLTNLFLARELQTNGTIRQVGLDQSDSSSNYTESKSYVVPGQKEYTRAQHHVRHQPRQPQSSDNYIGLNFKRSTTTLSMSAAIPYISNQKENTTHSLPAGTLSQTEMASRSAERRSPCLAFLTRVRST
jgi:hypothetical protein